MIFTLICLYICVCCSSKVFAQRWNVPNRPSYSRNGYVFMPNIQESDLNNAVERGMSSFDRLKHLEDELWKKGLVMKRGTKESTHQAFFGNSRKVQEIGKEGLINVEASLQLADHFDLNEIQVRDGLSQFSLMKTMINKTCSNTNFVCHQAKYRTIDGSCNNLRNRFWGKSFTAFERLLPPDYANGLNDPRRRKDGGDLPSARLISSQLIPDGNFPHGYLTTFFVHWGQFIDHDITLTALTRANNGEGIRCCDLEIQKNPKLLHPACFPIWIPLNDTFYSHFRQTCMELVRSQAAPRPNCNFGPREQINQLTAYIDGSNIYGSTEEVANELRMFSGGKLKVNLHNAIVMLPKATQRSEQCQRKQSQQYCFMAGDIRVNENINLAIMHTIWLREHNRIAKELSHLNPHWDDESLYQESRRIVGAEIQHIVYQEYLPLLLGQTVYNTFNLQLKPEGYSLDYNSSVNPSILNSFATAAYRFGHTLMQGLIDLKMGKHVNRQLSLSDYLFNPSPLYRKYNLEMCLKGMVDQPAQTYDRYVTEKLTNHLFESPGQQFGLDLVALNIQRGRDHGIQTYNEWRKVCKLSPVTSFSDLELIVGRQTARIFRRLYSSIEDIDLFPAGISEHPLTDGVLGPTFACIIAEQFRRVKFGDRFWYENGGEPTSFTPDQLREIRKSTLARILCDNSDNLDYVQKKVLLRHADWNPKVSCGDEEEIPRVHLDPWFDQD